MDRFLALLAFLFMTASCQMDGRVVSPFVARHRKPGPGLFSTLQSVSQPASGMKCHAASNGTLAFLPEVICCDHSLKPATGSNASSTTPVARRVQHDHSNSTLLPNSELKKR
jgi:hypothetical protein